MPRKSGSSSGPHIWKETWKDTKERAVPRTSNGRFSGKVVLWVDYYRPIKPKQPRDSHGKYVKKKQPEVVFGKGNYKYMVKFWIEGRKKPEVIGIDSEKDMYAPPGSFNRKAIYARIREIIEKSDKKVRRLRLLTTFDMGTGKRVIW